MTCLASAAYIHIYPTLVVKDGRFNLILNRAGIYSMILIMSGCADGVPASTVCFHHVVDVGSHFYSSKEHKNKEWHNEYEFYQCLPAGTACRAFASQLNFHDYRFILFA